MSTIIKKIGRPTNAERLKRLVSEGMSREEAMKIVYKNRVTEPPKANKFTSRFSVSGSYDSITLTDGRYSNSYNDGKVERRVVSTNTLYSSPTNNCQLFSIASFCNMIKAMSLHRFNEEEASFHFDEFMRGVCKSSPKRLMFVDVPINISETMDRYLKKDSVKVRAPYTSTNSHSMVIYLINLNKYLPKE